MAKIDVEKMSFEEALGELETLVGKIDAGDLPLAEAVETFKLATALSEHCTRLLKEAEAAVEELQAEKQDVAGDEEDEEASAFGDEQ